jgi:prolyl-tRNA synthetase
MDQSGRRVNDQLERLPRIAHRGLRFPGTSVGWLEFPGDYLEGMASSLTTRATDFPRWYQDVIARAELADNGPVRGTMVIRPWAYAIWERIQLELDSRIKEAGAENAYFPLLIPESYLHKEAEHVEGFSPELAVVTHAGGEELAEPVVVRPTSETIINSYFAKWVQSHRDLPLLINQWANVVRWELRPRLFLRTTEFLWQEGHTAHAGEGEARAYALRILTDVYQETMVDVVACSVLTGHKTARERFAGAIRSWTCEGMMGDGKALQMGTSHELGQNFARAFGTRFATQTGGHDFAWQTSWGVSTRLIGALIMIHGDDAGLRLPPRLAPVQVVVVLVRDEEGTRRAAEALAGELQAAGYRVRLDDKVATSFGRRSVDWELKGVPLRVEVGPRDLANGEVIMVRRDTLTKRAVPLAGVVSEAGSDLLAAQRDLLAASRAARETRTVQAATLEDAAEGAATGFATLPLAALGPDGEAELAVRSLTVRCVQRPDGSRAEADDEPGLVAVIAKAY